MYLVQLTRMMKNADEDRAITADMHKQEVTMKKLNQYNQRAFHPCWLLLTFFRVIGLATFSMQSTVPRRNGATKSSYFLPSRFGIAYNVLLTLLIIGVNYFSLPCRYYLDNSRKASLSKVIEIAQGILGTLVVSVMFLTHAFRQMTFVRIANRLLDVDLDAQQFKGSNDYKQTYVGILICSIFNCLVMGTLLLDYIAYHNSPIVWFTDTVPTILVGWFMLQYFFVLRVIESRFADVNRSIQSLPSSPMLESASGTLGQMQRVFVSSSTMNELLRLENVHARLHEILAGFTDFYSPPMLCAIGFHFLSLIYNGYFAIALFLPLQPFNVWSLASTMWWLMFLNYPLLMLTTKVHVISTEIDRTGNIVHSLMSRTIDEKVKAQLQQFSLELLHRNVQVTACGFFVLDNTLYHSMIAAATTYLVILVQFQTGSMSKSS